MFFPCCVFAEYYPDWNDELDRSNTCVNNVQINIHFLMEFNMYMNGQANSELNYQLVFQQSSESINLIELCIIHRFMVKFWINLSYVSDCADMNLKQMILKQFVLKLFPKTIYQTNMYFVLVCTVCIKMHVKVEYVREAIHPILTENSECSQGTQK